MKRFFKWLKKQFTKCKCCGRFGAERRRQNTAYDNDEFNFATLCKDCQEQADEHWRVMWEEYYAGRL